MNDKDILKQRVVSKEDMDDFLMGVLRGMVVEGYCDEICGEILAKAYHLANTVTFEPTYSKD